LIAEIYTRDGNTFYYIDGKWVLVDGDWFDELKSFQREYIIYPQPVKFPVISLIGDPPSIPAYVDIKIIRWNAIRYGYRIKGNSFIKLSFCCENGKIPFDRNMVDYLYE